MAKKLIIKVDDVGHEPYYLQPKEEMRIGRSKDNNIVIIDPTVSRNHAVIKWKKKYPRIIDCKSTASMYIDDQPTLSGFLMTSHIIKLGNTILFTNIIDPKAKDIALDNSLDESNEVVLYTETSRRDIKGNFSSTKELHSLLINLEECRRTGTLFIKTRDKSGSILFGLGRIKQAKYNIYENHLALKQLCAFSRGSYHFSTSIDVCVANLNESPLFYIKNFNHFLETKKLTRRLY